MQVHNENSELFLDSGGIKTAGHKRRSDNIKARLIASSPQSERRTCRAQKRILPANYLADITRHHLLPRLLLHIEGRKKGGCVWWCMIGVG